MQTRCCCQFHLRPTGVGASNRLRMIFFPGAINTIQEGWEGRKNVAAIAVVFERMRDT